MGRLIHIILCNLGLHYYKYDLLPYNPSSKWLVRKWRCVICGKENKKLNIQEIFNVKSEDHL